MGTLTGPGLGKFVCNDLSTCSLQDLGTADAGDITSGTFDVDRIPILPIGRYGSAVLVDGSRAMEGTLNMGSHQIDEASKVMFTHDVAFKANADYVMYLQDKADTTWANLHVGWLDAHAGIYAFGTVDMQSHPLTGVVAPTLGSHAANKNFVDDHVWDNAHLAGGITSDKIPALSGTAIAYPINADTVGTTQIIAGGVANSELAASGLDISKFTIGTAGVDRIPILPTDRYGSAVLVSGTRLMEGTFNTGNHPIDDVSKIGFRDIHDVALITEGTYSISVVKKDESLWGILETGHLFTHAGFAWYIEDKVAGEILYAGGLVNLRTADGEWHRTDADTEVATKGLLGIPMANIVEGNTGKVCIFGRVTYAGWSWTVGATLYVACAVGEITETAPSGSGDQVRKIGHALSSDTIIFNPDATILELV